MSCYKIQMRGDAKWTTLRAGRVMYYGDGYQLTKDQAFANAQAELADHLRAKPERKFRIVGDCK